MSWARGRGARRQEQRIDARLAELRAGTNGPALHLGCGNKRLEGMLNADAFDESVRDVALNAVDLGRYSDGSVDLIEAHHLLEHLTHDDARAALAEWRRVLRPGGTVVLTLPDLDQVVALWQRSDHHTRYLREQSPIVAMLYGSQEHPGMFHHWGYTQQRLAEELCEAGFAPQPFIAGPYPVVKTTPSMVAIAERP